MRVFNRTLAGRAAVLMAALLSLSACTAGRQGSDLAVAKLSSDQIQATPYLPLNDDHPGTPVDPQGFAVAGKYTVVMYYSPYVPECSELLPRLSQLPQFRDSIAVRTVNINRPEAQGVDWQSPIVQMDGIASLPYFRIYDPTRQLRAHGRPAYEQVIQWVSPPAQY